MGKSEQVFFNWMRRKDRELLGADERLNDNEPTEVEVWLQPWFDKELEYARCLAYFGG